MNTGADVSYLLKAREALNESEKAEREGRAFDAKICAGECMVFMDYWRESIKEKEAA